MNGKRGAHLGRPSCIPLSPHLSQLDGRFFRRGSPPLFRPWTATALKKCRSVCVENMPGVLEEGRCIQPG